MEVVEVVEVVDGVEGVEVFPQAGASAQCVSN